MKTAQKVIVLFKDGVGARESFADALQPNPNYTLHRLEDSFELSLEKYGIKDEKASGSIFNFVNDKGVYEVSIVLVENYFPPILACALNEVLAVLFENSLNTPTLVVPFLVEASKLRVENKNPPTGGGDSLWGLQFGPVNNSTQALASKIQKPPKFQINHEQLSCLLHLLRALDIPAFVLVGQYAQRNASKESLQVINIMGDYLANFSSLSFTKERITWNPSESSNIREEPWHALYG